MSMFVCTCGCASMYIDHECVCRLICLLNILHPCIECAHVHISVLNQLSRGQTPRILIPCFRYCHRHSVPGLECSVPVRGDRRGEQQWPHSQGLSGPELCLMLLAHAGCLCFSAENLSLASHIDSSLNRQVASDCVWAADNDRHY